MTTYDTLKQAVLDAEWYLADYPVARRKDPRGEKRQSIFAAADAIRAAAREPVEPPSLMTDDTMRVEAALKWLEDYNDALNEQLICPNGDDWSDTVQGIVSILRDGFVPEISLKQEGR